MTTTAMDWVVDAVWTAQLAQLRGMEPGARGLRKGDLAAILGRDPFTTRWHLGISHPTRNPTWEEIHEARYALIPYGAYMAMILPPQGEYVNVHQCCFHLFEIPAEVAR